MTHPITRPVGASIRYHHRVVRIWVRRGWVPLLLGVTACEGWREDQQTAPSSSEIRPDARWPDAPTPDAPTADAAAPDARADAGVDAGPTAGTLRVLVPNGGEVQLSTDGTTCLQDCEVAVAAGTEVTLYAGGAIRPFSGWSGACAGTERTCTFTVGAGGAIVRANYALPVGATWVRELAPGLSVRSIDLLDDNRVLLGTNQDIRMWSATGAELWVQPTASWMARSSATGAIYARTQNRILRLAPTTGAVMWSVVVDSAAYTPPEYTSTPRSLATGPSDEVVAVTSTGIVKLTSDGAVAWQRVLSYPTSGEVAVGPTGEVLALVANQALGFTHQLERFTPSGVSLGVHPWGCREYLTSLDVDGTGATVCASSTQGVAHLDRIAPGGNVLASAFTPVPELVNNAAAGTDNGTAVWAYGLGMSYPPTGMMIDRLTPSGSRSTLVSLLPISVPSSFLITEVLGGYPHDLAVAQDGERFAAGGDAWGIQHLPHGWVMVGPLP